MSETNTKLGKVEDGRRPFGDTGFKFMNVQNNLFSPVYPAVMDFYEQSVVLKFNPGVKTITVQKAFDNWFAGFEYGMKRGEHFGRREALEGVRRAIGVD